MEVRSSTGALVIGPDQQEAVRRNGVAARDKGLKLVSQCIGEIIAGKINSVRAVVVKFEPIVVFVAVERVLKRASVAGHPFIDGDGQWRASGVIRATGSDIEELLAVEALAIGE